MKKLLFCLIVHWLACALQAEVIVPKASDQWAYLHILDGTDPVTADPDFNSTWFHPTTTGYPGDAYDGPVFTTGTAAPFHYGTVNCLSGGTVLATPDAGQDRSAYFYRVFDGGSGFINLKLSLLADDGAFVYLNGVLIARDGVADPDTFGQSAALGDETSYDVISLIGTPVVNPGPNLLAISVHQYSTDSTDLGFDLELSGTRADQPVAVTRGPYLQSAADDRITVRWRTDQPGTSVVRYGNAPGNLSEQVEITGLTTEHIVALTGLAAGTTYYYQIETAADVGTISAGNDSDHYFVTPPAPGTRQPTRIWITGDTGTVSTAKQDVYNSYLARTAGLKTDLWLMLGDNAYDDGTDAEFQAALFDSYPATLRNTVVWSAIGNHETVTGNGAPYLDLHTFPTAGESGGVSSGTERYYSFDHGNIHFIAIDSETAGNYDDVPGTGGMIDWLEQDLRNTAQDWIVAFMHHGPYTRGTIDSDSTDHLVEMRQYVIPLLEKYGADLVLSGHSHVYERSMLINGHHSQMSAADSTSATFQPAVHIKDAGNGSTLGRMGETSDFLYDGGDGAYQKPLGTGETGTVYVICGASGKLSGWINGSYSPMNPFPHPVFSVGLLAMGSMIVEIDNNSLHAQYIDAYGSVRDDFTIVKGSTVELLAADAGFGEYGDNNTATLNFTRSGATDLAEDISYLAAGSALPELDFTPALSGTISFAVGETSKQLTLTRQRDSLAEGPETIDLTLVENRVAIAGGPGLRQLYRIGSSTTAAVTLLDTPARQWWFESFGPGETTSEAWQLDSDGDGLTRLEELAFGGSEGADDRDRLPSLVASPADLALNYFRNQAVPGLRYRPERSDDLSSWETSDIADALDGPPAPGGIEQWKCSTATDPDRQFLRLRIELEE